MAKTKSFKDDINPAMTFITPRQDNEAQEGIQEDPQEVKMPSVEAKAPGARMSYPKAKRESVKLKGVNLPDGYRLVKEPKSHKLTLLVRPTVLAKARAKAIAKETSINDLVNNFLEQYANEK